MRGYDESQNSGVLIGPFPLDEIDERVVEEFVCCWGEMHAWTDGGFGELS